MKAGVYKIQHKESGRLYVGSSQDWKLRLRKHKEHLRRKEHANPALQNAFNMHGEEAFDFVCVLVCSQKNLLMYEQSVMDFYKAYVKPYGYNSRKKAESNLGMTHETIHEPGKKYGRLTLVERYDKEAGGKRWLCKCDCGKTTVANVYAVKGGGISSCGCLKTEVLRKLKRHVHKPGEKKYRLTFVSPVEKGCMDSAKWLMRCDCGTEKVMTAVLVARGQSQSCGCLKTEVLLKRSTTHNASYTKEYITWRNMKHRCYDPKNNRYHMVGAKGIRVCDRWLKFESFLSDMGKCPKGLNLRRLNTNKDYELSNCKWATREECSSNSRRARKVMVLGKELNVGEAEKVIGIHRASINQRVNSKNETYQQATDHFVAKYMKK